MEYCYHCMAPMNGGKYCIHCGSSNADVTFQQHQLRPGTILEERYLLGESLGKGAFGITYIGMDLRLEMKVAVKEYYPSVCANRASTLSPYVILDQSMPYYAVEGKKKFLQEARILASFRNTGGIVNIYDYFETNNTAYIVMEYLEGQTLKQVLKAQNFSPEEIFPMMVPVMDSLAAVHRKSVIHRDISPDNLMLTPEHKLVLMDFGAARQFSTDSPSSMTIMVKHGYAPEEQYRAHGEVGPWTDVYALCATIYHCLTGVRPPEANERYIHDTIRLPAYYGVSLTDAQEIALERGLIVNAERRIRSMDELKKILYGDLNNSGRMPQPETPIRAEQTPLKHAPALRPATEEQTDPYDEDESYDEDDEDALYDEEKSNDENDGVMSALHRMPKLWLAALILLTVLLAVLFTLFFGIMIALVFG